jgi:hypothetical protein
VTEFDVSADVNPYGPNVVTDPPAITTPATPATPATPSSPPDAPVSPPEGIPGIGLSIIRTFIPAVVGALITVLAKIGAHVDSASLEVFISTVVTAVYYAGVRILEVKVGPRFGWLLGAPKAPTY